MPMAYQLFHSTVDSIHYRSRGSLRRNESHCIFHYTVRGQGEVIYRGVPYKTGPGEGFFHIINQEDCGYGYPKNSTEPWEFVVICFRGGNIRQIVSELTEKQVVYSIPNPNEFARVCKALSKDVDPGVKLTCFSRLVAMVTSADQAQSPLKIRFQRIVEQKLMQNPTISAIASEMQMSREHLQREFLKQTGITPAKYLNSKRFEHLCYLLSTPASEGEIAEKMHFPSVSGMSLFFKRMAGVTPRQFRKNGYWII